MTNWFSKSERGSWWSWWNVSHNLGATGTATGLTGLFGYLLGSASAGWVMGKLADLYGWDGGFYALIASSFLAFGFIAITLFNKKSAE